jgi:penicillin amidase
MPALSAAFVLLSLFFLPASGRAAEIPLPGLSGPVELAVDQDGVPHLFASDDFDLARAQGYLHAGDRLFQMDVTRREASGRLAELLGPGSIGSDIELRTIGLRRAAARTEETLTPRQLALLQAYADGVNHWVATHPLPAEYPALELTEIPAWEPRDSLVIGKAIAASLSLDIDAGPTADLARFIEAGSTHGFDGEALFFEDVRRAAPMDPASTVPDATSSLPFLSAMSPALDPKRIARTGAAARRIEARLARAPRLARLLDRRERFVGSNEWGVAAEHSASGGPLIANDPHLALDSPSTFYELHLVVGDDPVDGPLNVSGVGFPGVPGVILGQNEHISWGATTNPMDVTDLFFDELHAGQACEPLDPPAFVCIFSAGEFHAVEVNLNVRYQARRMHRHNPGVLCQLPFRSRHAGNLRVHLA